jgi:hypothetical protein
MKVLTDIERFSKSISFEINPDREHRGVIEKPTND